MAASPAPRRLGLVVNPIAGMGGRVALKGTDGAEALRIARERGAVPIAPERARRALVRLAAGGPPLQVVAAPGAMGGDIAAAAGVACEVTGPAPEGPTTAADTRAAVAAMGDVDLLLFAGGDGTARDVIDAGGRAVPLVGVPTGVKMHSGVFAATPDAAATAAVTYLRDPHGGALCAAEVADVDEAAAREGRVTTRLYGSALVPRLRGLMVASKASSPLSSESALDALCARIAQTLPADDLTLVGPGTTTARVLHHLGLPGTLLGVDAVRGGELVGADLDEAGVLALLDGEEATLIVGVVGGQGSLFGRGNQQLSPRVLRALGRDRIRVVAGVEKLVRLDPPALRVDTGDDALDTELSGYLRVEVAPGQTIVMKVST
jgi:predicted polyphosphate/ATP-dependent NAD kinase